MALDKQRILSELGSVVNQLQSADCGCIGKLFSNPGQVPTVGSHCGGCHRGCCHGHESNNNCNVPFVGEPYSTPVNPNMNKMCIGNCNPPKLYADTYNYLNKNLMQPVVQEVYHDLKTINPTNTITNNPIAGQMGLSLNNVALKGNTGEINQTTFGGIPNYETTGMSGVQNYTSAKQNIGGMSNYTMPMGNINTMRQTNHPTNQPMGSARNVDGMGAHIANMMMGNNSAKPVGNMLPSSAADNPQPSEPRDGTGLDKMYYGQENSNSFMQNPTTQCRTHANNYNISNIQGSLPINDMPQNDKNPSSQGNCRMNTSPVGQQITGHNNRGYGQHNPGISKFNEMFPGVTQGGDLGFDPMSIALQMNPANQQKTAMNTMQKIMNSNSSKGFDTTKNSNSMQSANANIAQPGQEDIISGSQSTNQLMTIPQAVLPNQISNQLQPTQDMNNFNVIQPLNQIPQQPVYTAVTGAPLYQQIPCQQTQLYQQQQYQQPQNRIKQRMIDPNAGAAITSPNLPIDLNGQIEPNAQNVLPAKSLSPQPFIKEPIFPVDTLKNRIPQNLKSQNYQYNTLGQPIEMTSAKPYHLPEPQLPQTLSPQPDSTTPRREFMYSNVKNTVSKTSIFGHNPVGRAPSRNQLQSIYNQYKGSRSFTQQNVNEPHNMTYSDRKLNVPPGNGNPPQSQLHQVPIEKVAGDTLANNRAANDRISNKVEPVTGQIGDVPASNMPTGDGVLKTEPAIKQSKCRNGLQDMTYTSYPTSAAWSFHGVYPRPTISTNYRYSR